MAFTTIKKGDYNDYSKKAQQLLNAYGIKTDTDGYYSDATYGAVSEFQDRHGLNVTGEIDELTWNKLLEYDKPADGGKDLFNQTTGNVPVGDLPVGDELLDDVLSGGKKEEETGNGNSNVVPEPDSKKENGGNGYEYVTFEPESNNPNVKYPFEDKFNYESFKYTNAELGNYKDSEIVKQAEKLLSEQLQSKPQKTESTWQEQLKNIISEIANRKDFSYDMNGDALYQQYKDKYIQQGKMAMQDAMGQAAAMTGGYGNSYAATVGNQAYQAQLNNLNDIIPELYQMALDRHNLKTNEMYKEYAMLNDQVTADYNKYLDDLAAWQSERDYLAGRYDSERDFAYGQYIDDRNFEYNKYADDKNYAYNEYLNAIDYDRWRQQFEYEKGRDQIKDEQWAAELAESVRQFDEQMAAKYPSGTESEVVPLTEEEKQNLIPTAAEYADKGEEELKSYLADLAARGLSAEEAKAIYETFFPTDRSGMTFNSQQNGAETEVKIDSMMGDAEIANALGVRGSIVAKVRTFTTNNALANYLDGLESDGTITTEQADALYNAFVQDTSDLMDRNWSMVTNGGANLFGVDKNAVVKDQYGNEFTLDELMNALIEEGMNESAAKDFVIKLQKDLGISSAG